MQWLNIHEGVRPRMFHTSCLLGYSTNTRNLWRVKIQLSYLKSAREMKALISKTLCLNFCCSA